MAFQEQSCMRCGDIPTKMVEHEIYLYTLVLSHIGHVDNIAETRSGSISRRCLAVMHSFSVNFV